MSDYPILEVRGLSVGYGQVTVLKDVDLLVDKGEIVAMLGSNGAGKTTTLLSIVGLLKRDSGSIQFRNRDIGKLTTEDIVRSGMTMTPEGRHVFEDLTVLENLRMGAAFRSRGDFERMLEEVLGLFPVLAARRHQLGGTLSGGEQQMLAIGRSLMSEPELLLLDEPSLGLAPQIVDAIFSLIVQLKQRGTTILLVEQNARMALEVSDRGYVIANGGIVASGASQELMSSGDIARAYLGAAG
ncbi:MAG: ABC transporter ATP-binding protein [Gammaproteobacteria bacterium]|nr:ABC transporter ATP-binding protein [Gammaproteobacteria bacterium]